jgi:hypothetical protein
MSVNPSLGGRITSFTVQGTEILHTSGDMSGSTFWTSPQSGWNQEGWPPPAAIDNAPYSSPVIADAVLTISSSPDPGTRLSVTKTFTGDISGNRILVTYRIHNATSSPKTAAPWEITRVRPSGLTFFPKGQTFPASNTLAPTREDQVVWFKHNGENDKKMFRDGAEQWIAHLGGSFLFVKKYSSDIPVSSFAPGESEIEVYAASSYVEVEEQGAYAAIPAGGEIAWSVEWYAAPVEAGVDKGVGSADLLESAP